MSSAIIGSLAQGHGDIKIQQPARPGRLANQHAKAIFRLGLYPLALHLRMDHLPLQTEIKLATGFNPKTTANLYRDDDLTLFRNSHSLHGITSSYLVSQALTGRLQDRRVGSLNRTHNVRQKQGGGWGARSRTEASAPPAAAALLPPSSQCRPHHQNNTKNIATCAYLIRATGWFLINYELNKKFITSPSLTT